jgi:2-polyprenyl-6-hydroxyphenyl methylase/3-demethylubiquinone-9 3-methyltransferase
MREAAQSASSHAGEVERGDRFEFGENWQRFLGAVDAERVDEAERSLRVMLGVESLAGKTFLDVGSGSGLFSLAARRMGAERVHSFDFDPSSAACARELRRRFYDGDPRWTIEQGSILDADFMSGLGRWDVVYAWGVLHHTGAMWQAFENAQAAVGDGGMLFVSIYNDQGLRSRLWRVVKQIYNGLPGPLRMPFVALVMGPRELLVLGATTVSSRGPVAYVRRWTQYKRERGMSRVHDMFDWIGGYPFEVAKPEEVFSFCRARGLVLERLVTRRGGSGCNEFVFLRR